MGCGEPWVTVEDTPCDESSYHADALADACALATRVLYLATGRRYGGECTATLDLCDLAPVAIRTSPIPAELIGSCGCGRSTVLQLRGYPVNAVEEVVVDAVVLAPSAWQLRHRRYLVRLDGEAWPCCHTAAALSGATITYRWGLEPPAGAGSIAGLLACEYAKAWGRAADCRLPAETQSIVYEGTSLQLIDPGALIAASTGPNGMPKFGITEVDNWVRAENPGGLRRRARIIDPARVARRLIR